LELIKTKGYNSARNAKRVDSIRESKEWWLKMDAMSKSKGQLWGFLVDSAIDPEAGIKERRVSGWKGELSQLEDLTNDRRKADY
jgi:hypothetical protein